jgi:hypothetical protein
MTNDNLKRDIREYKRIYGVNHTTARGIVVAANRGRGASHIEPPAELRLLRGHPWADLVLDGRSVFQADNRLYGRLSTPFAEATLEGRRPEVKSGSLYMPTCRWSAKALRSPPSPTPTGSPSPTCPPISPTTRVRRPRLSRATATTPTSSVTCSSRPILGFTCHTIALLSVPLTP